MDSWNDGDGVGVGVSFTFFPFCIRLILLILLKKIIQQLVGLNFLIINITVHTHLKIFDLNLYSQI